MKLFANLMNNNLVNNNLKSDHINEFQYKTNLLYLMQAKKIQLYPPKILSEFVNHDDKENIIEYYNTFNKSQKDLLKKVTPIVIKIAYNLYIPTFGGHWFIPQLIQDNPSKYYWYISAYPDVFDYFFMTMDCIKAKEQNYINHFDKITKSRRKDSDACMNIFEEKYGNGNFSTNIAKENLMQNMIVIQKDYYKNILKKKLLLAK